MNLPIKANFAVITGRRGFFLSAWLLCACLVSVASMSLAAALSAPQGSLPSQSFELDFKEYKLKNGLKVILAEDHSAPTYSICVTYNVGSRDERPGRTGFAHLFEHILFQGSENVGKGEHLILVQNNGGRANGTTSADRTNYYETLPANQLELGIFLEADRMRAPNITQANFDNQRLTVQEERRQSYDNRPYGKTYEAVIETAYDAFAYKHSTIGSMDDLNAATLNDATEFFRTYYAPNNAVLSLVGDFNIEVALKLIKKYFENIPAQAPPPKPDVAEPEQIAERRKTIEDNFAPTARIDIVHKIPPGDSADWYALSVLGQVLSQGASSRLHQKLVKEKEIAQSVSAGADERRGPSLFWVSVGVRPGSDLAVLERLVYDEIERLQHEPIADWELDKIRMQVRREQAQQLYSTRRRANSLGQYAVFYDNPNLINTVWQKYRSVGKADLQRVAKKYFSEGNRSVIITMPKPKATSSPADNR
ncbi:MAG TPA: pitrilysin family protein [Candidatus Binatia bacterium]|jgi:predicted Zn-dependent peptidase